MDRFEVKPDDIRRSANDIKQAVSEIPRDVLHRVDDGVDHGHDGVANAMDEFCVGVVSAVDILRNTAEEAGMALRSIAAEYEGHDMKQSEDLASKEWGVQKPWKH